MKTLNIFTTPFVLFLLALGCLSLPVMAEDSSIPVNATFVFPQASSIEKPDNIPALAFDGKTETRWCAVDGNYPQWLSFTFQQPAVIEQIQLVWESQSPYQYRIEGTSDGAHWTTLVDASQNKSSKPGYHRIAKPAPLKTIRITGLSRSHGGWCSIREVLVKGKQANGKAIEKLWPVDQNNKPYSPKPVDPYKQAGNIPPVIEPLTPEQEAKILKDVKVADGFEATLFAAPPAVNYPVFVAAAPEGTLFVSSDGNGSLGRSPKRGRIIRLKDTNGDGRADQTNVFCEIDAPRGLVWDKDRLYVMHPPHLSVFIDYDHDGVADEQKILVKNLAFGYDKRPADHTTNGLSMGPDGWLYIAGGDFGFMNATGTDGTTLTHRAGGVIRVRPDGTGLEIYSTGTRNILEVAISPSLDIFARDNTNDGGGWDVRFHHFTGSDDHGYPRLYINFPEEIIAPLADYGGGSGCGAVYIDEPGFGKWNNAPFTADWGTGALWHHSVTPQGATYKETQKPQPFVKMTRPTDADVDAMSRLYVASWKGATFNWNGPNVGYIVCVKPKAFHPKPLPEFDQLADDELVALFDDASYRRRMEAMRELQRRNNPKANLLLSNATASYTPERKLVAELTKSDDAAALLEALTHSDPVVVHIAIRRLAALNAVNETLSWLDQHPDHARAALRALAMMHNAEAVQGIIKRVQTTQQTPLKRELLTALCRLYHLEGKWKGDSWGTRPDTRGPYYQPATWEESQKIFDVLQKSLSEATPEEASWLVETMTKNRISSDQTLDRLLKLAETHDEMLAPAVNQLAGKKNISELGKRILIKAASSQSTSPVTLKEAVISLVQLNDAQAVRAVLKAMAKLKSIRNARNHLNQAQERLFASQLIENQITQFSQSATTSESSFWGTAVVLQIAARPNASPEALSTANTAINQLWSTPEGQKQLVEVAIGIKSHTLDERILALKSSADSQSVALASRAMKELKIAPPEKDSTPKVGELTTPQAIEQAVATKGNLALGEQLFTRANCVACHTTSKSQVQKGPYLGNIAATYKRKQLAEAILVPDKTIAQGFATTLIATFEGKIITGFVTKESADRVQLRDAQAKEYDIDKEEIIERKTLTTSVMPKGLFDKYSVKELASLLDYLEALTANQKK